MTRLFVQPLNRRQLFVAAELCTLDGTLQYPNGLVIDTRRNGERMSILATMGEGIASRITEAARSAMHDLGDERQRLHGAGANLGCQQQFSKVFRAVLRGGGK